MADDEKQSLAFLRLAIPFDTTRSDDSALLAALAELPNGMKAAVVRYMLLGAFQSLEAQGIDAIIADALREQKARGRSRGRPTLNKMASLAGKRVEPKLQTTFAAPTVAPRIEVAASKPAVHAPAQSEEVQVNESQKRSSSNTQESGKHSLKDFANLIA